MPRRYAEDVSRVSTREGEGDRQTESVPYSYCGNDQPRFSQKSEMQRHERQERLADTREAEGG